MSKLTTMATTAELETRRARAINHAADVLDDVRYGGYAEMVRRRTITAQKALNQALGFLKMCRKDEADFIWSVEFALRTAEFWEV